MNKYLRLYDAPAGHSDLHFNFHGMYIYHQYELNRFSAALWFEGRIFVGEVLLDNLI